MITASDVLEETGPVEGIDIDRVIQRATATLERELHRFLSEPASVAQILEGGSDTLYLQEEPIVGDPTPTLTVETRLYPTGAWSVEDAADYVVEGRVLRRAWPWPPGPNTRVTYTRGFETGEGPEELQDVVKRMVVERIAEMTASAEGTGELKSETLGDYSYTNFSPTELAKAAAASGSTWESFVRRWRRQLV